MVAPARKGAFGILCCPVCRADLTLAGGSLVCTRGHSFDLARSGYVNLTFGRSRRAAASGDTSAQLQHRSTFLGSSRFDFISDEILRQVRAGGWTVSVSQRCVLDAGCGTGYHLGRIAGDRLDGAATYGLGLDLSKQAVRMASRDLENLGFAVTDLWAEWPVRSGSVDLVLNLFAPKNFAEMARVLTSEGLLAMAYPGAQHLIELRQAFGLMGIEAGKAERYRRAAQRSFREIRRTRFRRHADLSADDVVNVIWMGPNATRVAPDLLVPASAMSVTFDVEILFARFPQSG